MDKLDGSVPEEFYRPMSAQWRDEVERCQRDLTRHQNASNDYMDEGVALLTLARKAHHLFESATGIEKRRLLNFVLSNCVWQYGELRAEYRQPFDLLMETINHPEPPQGGEDGQSSKIAKWQAFVLSYRTLVEAPDTELRVRLDEIRRDDLQLATSR